MSYTNRFTSLVLAKHKLANSDSKRGGGSSSSSSSNGVAKTTDPFNPSLSSTMTGKTRAGKVTSASLNIPPLSMSTKPPSTAPGTLTAARRRSNSVSRALKSTHPLPYSPSDDYSSMLILKKKTPSKSLPQHQHPQALNKLSSLNAKGLVQSGKKDSGNSSRKEAVPPPQQKKSGFGSNKSPKSASKSASGTNQAAHEGPIKLSGQKTDLAKLFAEAVPWNDEDDESGLLIKISESQLEGLNHVNVNLEGETEEVAVSTSSSFTLACVATVHSSSSRGRMIHTCSCDNSLPGSSKRSRSRPGTSGEDKAPTTTSGEELRAIGVDHNNNTMFETIANTIFGGFGFYTQSASSGTLSDGLTSSATSNTANAVSRILTDAAALSTGPIGRELSENQVDVMAGADLERAEINSASLDNNNNRNESNSSSYCYNGDNSTSTSTYGVYLKGSDSVLIPSEIEEQLQRAYGVTQNNPQGDQIQLTQKHHQQQQHQYHHHLHHSPNLYCTSEGNHLDWENAGIELTSPDPMSPSCAAAAAPFHSNVTLEENGENAHDLVTSRTCSKRASHSSSFVSAASETDRFVYLEEPNGTSSQTCAIDLQDAETGSKSEMTLSQKYEKSKKLMSLVMAVNAGINIDPAPAPVASMSDHKKKSVRLKGIMKDTRPGTAHSQTNTEKDSVTRKTSSMSALSEAKKRRRENKEKRNSKLLPHKQTFKQVGADYGFPASLSISSLLENIVGMTSWASKDPDEKESGDEEESSLEKNDSNNSIVLCGKEVHEGGGGGGEESGLIGTAYDILTAGLKFASGLIGDEAVLVPKEDLIRYSGYVVKVVGKRLLLESIHVNCDFGTSVDEILSYGSTHSIAPSRPHTPSREKLEESCDGKRIRIVVRLNGPSSSSSSSTHLEEDDEVVNSIMHGEKHRICLDDGKWTLIYEKKNSGRSEARENFVEITCPTGVDPENLAYGFSNGRLVIDAP